MAQIQKSQKPIATRPIKSGQPLGAILGSLGLDRCIPLIHGAQGCSAFAKIFFIQHFQEPIPLQSTAMDPISTIMGSDDNIVAALATLFTLLGLNLAGLFEVGHVLPARWMQATARHPVTDALLSGVLAVLVAFGLVAYVISNITVRSMVKHNA